MDEKKEEEEEEEEENTITSFVEAVEGACAPTLRTPSARLLSASTRLECRDDVKARVAMRRDRHCAIVVREVIPLR